MSAQPVRRVYGLNIESEFPFQAPLASGQAEPDLVVHGCLSLTPADTRGFVHVYSSAYQDATGRPLFELHQDGERELLRFTDMAEFLFVGETISFRTVGSGSLRDVEILLLSSVLAYWLERRGILVIHASAAAIDDGAVAFFAPAGGGKSSMAMAFALAGYGVVSDDILPIDVGENEVKVRAGYPEIRINPDLGERLLDREFSGLRLFDPRAEKRCLDVSASRPEPSQDVLPLSAIYVLERRERQETSAPVEIVPVAGHKAVIEVVRSTYTPTLVEGVGLAASRLDQIVDLVRRVPLRRLEYDTDLDQLMTVLESVVTDVRGR